MMTSQNTSYWYAVFLNRPLWKKGFRRLRTKEDGGFHSGILQNPSDPDATYRSKAGKEHQGYVANLEETVDRNGSVITDYQFEQNIYSDSRFLKDSLERTEVQGKKKYTDHRRCLFRERKP